MFIGVQHGEKGGGVLKSSKISKLLMEHKHYSYPKAFIIMLSCLQNQMTSFYHRFFFYYKKKFGKILSLYGPSNNFQFSKKEMYFGVIQLSHFLVIY